MAVNLFNGIIQKLKYWREHQGPLAIKGISPQQWSLLLGNYFKDLLLDRHHFIVCSDQDEAENVFETLKGVDNIYFYPGHNHSFYSTILASEQILLTQWSCLYHLKKNSSSTIVTTWDGLLMLGVEEKFFDQNVFEIKQEDIISPFELAEKLVALGYHSTSTVEEPGTFSKKGEIFDIYPLGHAPVRLHYFDDLVEHIYEIDLATQKTNKEKTYPQISLLPAPGFLTKEEYTTNLRENIPQAQPAFKNKYELRKMIFRNLGEGQLFENYSAYIPLFFKNPKALIDYADSKTIISFINYEVGLKNYELFWAGQQEDFELLNEDLENANLLPSPDHFYYKDIPSNNAKTLIIEPINIQVDFDEKLNQELNLSLEGISSFLKTKMKQYGDIPDKKFEYIKLALSILKNELRHGGHLVITYKNDSSRQELEYLLRENQLMELGERLHFIKGTLDEGLYYRTENIFILSESDFFATKQRKAKKVASGDKDLFAEQIATLKVGDYVIHRDYGIGVYQGMETITAGDQQNDYLIIHYEGNDKVYVPVYKLNLVQKHADATSGLKVASLKSKKFNELKAKVRSSVKKLAFDLLKLQAQRKLAGGYPFSPPDHLYKEFELSFPFEETPDQEKAIFDVLEDMQRQHPMDRLVCGDVGFGKTEVAMRAAMKAVLDKKQVVVLVPTTVLALQHFHSFKKRFSQFPVNVDFVSRFKTPKEKQKTLNDVSEGRVDILIGTHAVLAESLKYHDLGLLIIDEEHRFGVGHKEKLKTLKSGIDVLTMTATPIPRTLQLSFLGIRDLSLIQTAPPRRQSIKTYIIKADDLTLKMAIEKELARGGQVYYIHNRVHDIEEHLLYLKKLVPNARISLTHGQMSERDIEKNINDFYEHKTDILLATTIVESGIDVPNANTMIIDRADTYGLAQLHQLRGRIGRSDRKAYAYFMIPGTRILSEIAQRRLHALQTYADMGSGFALASSDMEIRGAGDILGAEQSGHIESIGLEYYMDLLQEAILELRGEQKVSVKNLEIQASFSAYIPNSYITDHALRLKYYKRLSNSQDLKRLEEIISEITDAFGITPRELEALYCILRSRVHFQPLGIRLVKVAGSQIHLFFDEEILNHNTQLRDKILGFFMKQPKFYKLNPDASVTCLFKEPVNAQTLWEFSKHIAGQLGAC